MLSAVSTAKPARSNAAMPVLSFSSSTLPDGATTAILSPGLRAADFCNVVKLLHMRLALRDYPPARRLWISPLDLIASGRQIACFRILTKISRRHKVILGRRQ